MMETNFKKRKIFFFICIVLASILLLTFILNRVPTECMVGGVAHPVFYPSGTIATAVTATTESENIDERFTRPSKQTAYPNPYNFLDFYERNGKPPYIQEQFKTPKDVILAYYAILQNASNMKEYTGGCGSLVYGTEPYPYAYELFTKEVQQNLSLPQFINSFQGVGNLTLLNLEPAYTPPNTPPNVNYYMVEIELITGPKLDDNPNLSIGSYFTYYYGIVTTEKTSDGYRIQKIDYLPEDFLCAPIHGWSYDSDYILSIVYIENLKIVETVDAIQQEGNHITILASGYGKQYKFDFIRLTNGYDILLHESVLKEGGYTETNLLPDDWKYFKLSIVHPGFSEAH